MSFVPKPNTGSLWHNDKKSSDNHPDMRGEIVVDKQLLMDQINKGENPVKLSISAWNRTSLAGRDYMSLSVSEPFIPQPRADQQQKAAHDNSAEDDSDVPF
jgi:uncharacterized protein (DUF736 family)